MRRLLWAALALAALLFVGRWTVTTLADYWWGLAISPAAGRLQAGITLLKAALDLGGFLLAAAWFTGNLLLVHRAIGTVEVSRQIANIEVREALPARSTVTPFMVGGIVLGLVAGADFGRHWQAVVLAWHGVRYGVADPVLGHDAGLYVAQLPFWILLQRSVLILAAVTLVLVLGLYGFIGAIRWIDGRPAINSHARRHLGVLLAVLAVALAAGFLIEPFRLVGGGAGPLAARHYELASVASLVLTGTSAIAAIASMVWAWWARHWFLVAIWMILAAGSFLSRIAAASFSVPAEPLLGDSVTRRQLDAAAYDLASARDTLFAGPAAVPPGPGIPSLWDGPALQRVAMADSSRLVAANPGTFRNGPVAERAWLTVQRDRNGRAGVRAIADDRMSATGAPLYYHPADTVPAPMPAFAADLPATAVSPLADHVLLDPNANGVEAGNVFRRAVLAWALQQPGLLGRGRRSVRADWVRDPRERVAKVAPFAQWGDAQVRVDGNQVHWLVDGLVTATHFPLSTRVPGPDGDVGLARAAFVAIVDATTGGVRIFARPEGGPLAEAWTVLSRRLVEPWSEMPEDARAAMTYPAELLAAQAAVLERAATGRRVPGIDSLRLAVGSDDFFWGPATPSRTVTFVLGTPARVSTIAVGSTSEGRLHLTVFEVDSAVGLPGPGVLKQSWERFPTWVQIVDSVRAGGGTLTPGRVRYWVVPGALGAMQVQYGPRGGGGASVTWVNLAANSRLGAGRTFPDAWSNLQGSTIPAPPGDRGGVLADARKWFRIADSAFRRGDFTTFGRAFESLRAVLEVPPEEARKVK